MNGLVSLKSAFPFGGNWNQSVNREQSWGSARLEIRFPVWRELKPFENPNVVTNVTGLEIRFPVWRELKLDNDSTKDLLLFHLKSAFPFGGNWNGACRARHYHMGSKLEIRFPVWRELKLSFLAGLGNSQQTWNPLSRLEGIETGAVDHRWWSVLLPLKSAFPFGGNWNVVPNTLWYHLNCLKSAFPFGGNWNTRIIRCWQKSIRMPWNPLSRLEGIETANCCLGSMGVFYPWNPLSRLEGIETLLILLFHSLQDTWLEIRFPVWRELKHRQRRTILHKARQLEIRFPVWRELKLPSSDSIWWHRNTLEIRFPVWRELKPICRRLCMPRWWVPWNPLSRLEGIETKGYESAISVFQTWNPLSRLEGIETQHVYFQATTEITLEIRFPVWRELKPASSLSTASNPEDLKSAFPFGGNWNSLCWSCQQCSHPLEIRFPVWRELKRSESVGIRSVSSPLEIRFPVWRELKRAWKLHRCWTDCELEIRFPVWRELKL